MVHRRNDVGWSSDDRGSTSSAPSSSPSRRGRCHIAWAIEIPTVAEAARRREATQVSKRDVSACARDTDRCRLVAAPTHAHLALVRMVSAMAPVLMALVLVVLMVLLMVGMSVLMRVNVLRVLVLPLMRPVLVGTAHLVNGHILKLIVVPLLATPISRLQELIGEEI